MIRAKSDQQEVLFETPFAVSLDRDNRWVILAHSLPWDSLSSAYYKALDRGHGKPVKDARMVIGAVLIKHLCNFSDEETISTIQENVYMQYLVGLTSFSTEPIFDPSLFVTIRKRMGEDVWRTLNEVLLQHVQSLSKVAKGSTKDNNGGGSDDKTSGTKTESLPSGTILLDATVAPQDIKYPTDLGLLNDSREKLEVIIATISKATGQELPRRYTRKARRDYLLVAKNRKASAKTIRKGIGKQLRYIRRNFKHIDNLLEGTRDLRGIISPTAMHTLRVINTLFEQQKTMYDNKTHTVADRIVSIHQPHVRPMVRGKARTDVEFGSKISASLHEGYIRQEQLSWSSFDEARNLQTAAEAYKKRNGVYPEKIIGDRKYITREHRNWCKTNGIHLSGKPLGRPTINTKAQLKELKKDSGRRNAIEGKFGQGKQWYGLDKIRARLKGTSESWIGAIIFALNVVRFDNLALRTLRTAMYWLKLCFETASGWLSGQSTQLLFQ